MSTTTTQTKASGQEKPTKFVTHVKKYPTVESGISTFQSYPLGQKSVDTFITYYKSYLAPFLQNFSGPYAYIEPYVLKADGLADSGLKKVDSKLPIITKDPQAIKSTILDYAYSPFRLANDGKTYVLNTYGQEYKKCGGDDAGPVISGSKAAVTTSMVVTSDTLAWLGSFLSTKKAQGQDFASAKYQQGSQYVNGKTDEAISYASDTAEKARNLAYAKAEDAKVEGEKVKKEAKKQANK